VWFVPQSLCTRQSPRPFFASLVPDPPVNCVRSVRLYQLPRPHATTSRPHCCRSQCRRPDLPQSAQPLSSQSKPSYTSFCILHKSWHSGISHPFAWFRIFRSPTTCVHRPWRLYLLRPGLRPCSAKLDDRRQSTQLRLRRIIATRRRWPGCGAEYDTRVDDRTALEEL
jgi:hypothetical protein